MSSGLRFSSIGRVKGQWHAVIETPAEIIATFYGATESEARGRALTYIMLIENVSTTADA